MFAKHFGVSTFVNMGVKGTQWCYFSLIRVLWCGIRMPTRVQFEFKRKTLYLFSLNTKIV
jgi:hypothetical protein